MCWGAEEKAPSIDVVVTGGMMSPVVWGDLGSMVNRHIAFMIESFSRLFSATSPPRRPVSVCSMPKVVVSATAKAMKWVRSVLKELKERESGFSNDDDLFCPEKEVRSSI